MRIGDRTQLIVPVRNVFSENTYIYIGTYTLCTYKLAAPRIVFFFGQHMSRDYRPPGHENPAMGFLWGVDQD